MYSPAATVYNQQLCVNKYLIFIIGNKKVVGNFVFDF